MNHFEYDDYAPVLNKCPKLRKIIKKAGPCTIEVSSRINLFSRLARVIAYQQLTAKAASTIFARFLDLYKTKEASLKPEMVIKSKVEDLRTAGLSQAKSLAILDLAQKSLDGTLPPVNKLKKMSDEEVIKALTQVRGIGPWSAEMFMMFTLGRADIISLGDLGLKKGFGLLYKKNQMPTDEEFIKRSNKWKPYRTVACWYLWRALE